jgi:acetyl-CoA acetyltransferase
LNLELRRKLNSELSVAIVGAAESDLGKTPNRTVMSLQAQAAKAALEDAGLSFRDVDGVMSAGAGGWAPSLQLAEYLGISPRFTDSTNIGGSSFEAHVGHAVSAIRAGQCECVLIAYGSTQRSDASRKRAPDGNATRLNLQYEAPYGMPAPSGAYAMAATRHMYQYGTTPEQLARVAVKTRDWATLNPKALMREPITIEDVLNSPYICEPLHLLDCCLVTDGGGALIVASKEKARQTSKKPVWVLGHAEAHTHDRIASMPDLTVTPAAITGPRALELAGVKHSDLDIVEIYDSFTITVLLTLESLGFCKPGESGPFVEAHNTGPGGDFPLNTNGGGLSYTHPGMYGIFPLIEAVRQLRGECGDRQVPNAKLGLAHGTGGVLSSCGTCILGVE